MVKRFVVISKSLAVNIVLVEPEIPQNTGNIGRTCVGTGAKLHLVGQLGFELTDKQLKRAGLDYWQHLQWQHHKTWDDWWHTVPDKRRVFFFSKKATQSFYQLNLQDGDWLVFGKETKGLPESLLAEHSSQAVKIPFSGPIRSFNLANSVAMALGEALRQGQDQP